MELSNVRASDLVRSTRILEYHQPYGPVRVIGCMTWDPDAEIWYGPVQRTDMDNAYLSITTDTFEQFMKSVHELGWS